MISKEKLNKLNDLKKAVETSKVEAQIALFKARETQLLAENSELQMNLFIHQLYIEYKLDKADKINNETGEIIRADSSDTEPPDAPDSTKQLDLFTKEEEQ